MSKLDRQLDGVFGEKRVEIHWPKDEEVNLDLLRLQLISEIDSHANRVPLDLRGVHGAPEALVDLLVEMQRYAMSQSKVLSISASLPAMQEALNPRRRRKAGRPRDAIDASGSRDASEEARFAIRSHGVVDPEALLAAQAQADIDAERRVRSRTTGRGKRKEYVQLFGAILGLVLAGLIVYWYTTFDTEPLIYDHLKTFENRGQESGVDRVSE